MRTMPTTLTVIIAWVLFLNGGNTFQTIPGTDTTSIEDDYRLRWRDVTTNISTTIGEHCGASGLCQNERSRKASCSPCDPCFCDEACQKYGDCCIDKVVQDFIANTTLEDTLPLTAPHADCVDTRVRTNSRGGDGKLHTLIASCPAIVLDPHGSEHSLREGCDHSGRINQHLSAAREGVPVSQTSFWENWPVFSPATGISYKNEICAECHGESIAQLVRWNLEIGCLEALTPVMRMSEYDVINYVLRQPKCFVAFTAPQGVSERSCSYEEGDLISVCNATGQRMNYDLFLWKACQVFPGPPTSHGLVFYRNVFCVLCQSDRWMKIMSSCGQVIGSTFFLVINPGAVKRIADGHRSRCTCSEDQVWDPFSLRCRNVHCRPGSRLSKNATDWTVQCVPLDTLSKGLAYSLHLIIQVDSNSSSALPSLEENRIQYSGMLTNLLNVHMEIIDTNDIWVYSFLVYSRVDDIPSAASTSPLQEPFRTPNSDQSSGQSRLIFGVSIDLLIDYKIAPAKIGEKLLALDNKTWTIQFPTITDLTMTLTTFLAPEKPSVLDNVTSDDNEVNHFSLDNGTSTLMAFNAQIDDHKIYPADYLEVRNTLLCPYFVADDTLNVEIKAKTDDTSPYFTSESVLEHKASGTILSFKDFYRSRDGILILCAPKLMTQFEVKAEEDKKSRDDGRLDMDFALAVTSYVCLSISCLCMLATLVTYFLFRSLRTLPGKNIMALVFSLMGHTILCLVGNLPDSDTVLCQVVGVATHSFLLCSIAWMVIGSWHVHQVFTRMMDHASRSDEQNCRRFIKFCVVSISGPVLVVTSTIVANVIVNDEDEDDGGISRSSEEQNSGKGGDGIGSVPVNESFPCVGNARLNIGYGKGVCYLSQPLGVYLAALLPLGLGLLFNVVLFARTVWALTTMTSQQKMLKKDHTRQLSTYVKLSTLTGFNWIPGVLSGLVQSEALAYLFVLLAGLQGLYVFFAFVFNERVQGLYKSILTSDPAKKKPRKYLDLTSTPANHRKPIISTNSNTTATTDVDSPSSVTRSLQMRESVKSDTP